MRVVADTNVVVSGLLWQGAPRQVLDAGRTGAIDLFTSAVLLAELEEVLEREKFAERLARVNVGPRELVLGYAALATLVTPEEIVPVILADSDDDAVLACATAAQAEVIVSGDSHLLALKDYNAIRIVRAAELLARVSVIEKL
ncbi:MAG TPA: putative toxin-antitoxin system toxin component, PIN family [Blastocatellia bacterium]|nr:putative toxin-antitoxin system toxin component, PIN family [Blastocatellia bacterium]